MTNPRYQTANWRRLRKQCLLRDGGICQIGARHCLVVASAADHIVEIEDGGVDELWNLQAACKPCNTGKRNRSLARRAKRGREVREW